MFRKRSIAAPVVVLLVALAGWPASAPAADACRGLTGDAHKQCSHDQLLAITAANRAAADAKKRARLGGAAPSDAPAYPETPAAPGGTTSRGEAGPAILTSAPGRPVVTRDNNRPMLTIITQAGRSGREKRYTIPVTRNCIGQSIGSSALDFDKACRSDGLHNAAAAEPLFKQSCDEGDPSGCYMLATYLSGEKTWPQALALFKTACADGQHKACYEVAEAYRVGHGVPKDAAQTRAYYDQGCAAGNAYSCSWLQGKIDADCPHGFRSYRVDFNKNTYKVACVVPGAGISRTEYELKPSAAELADMKSYGAYMRDHKATPIGEVVREVLKSPEGSRSGCEQDIQDSNGHPISGSGCIGHDLH